MGLESRPKNVTPPTVPVGDLFNPFFDVTFYRPVSEQGTVAESNGEEGSATSERIDASKITVSTREGKQTLDEDTKLIDARKYASSLSVEMLGAGAYKATLTLTPPLNDAIYIIDHKLIRFGSLMEIRWGYVDDSSEPRQSDTGLFTIAQPSIKFGLDTQIQIVGYDILSSGLRAVDRRQIYKRAEKFKTDLDILTALVTPMGLQIETGNNVPAESLLRKTKPTDITQQEDNWTFFKRICHDNDAGFFVQGNVVYVYDVGSADLNKHNYRFIWYLQPDDNRDIPMTSFETNPILGFFAREGSRGQKAKAVDKDTGKPITQKDAPDTTKVGSVGTNKVATSDKSHPQEQIKTAEAGVTPNPKLTENDAGRYISQPAERPNREEQARQEMRDLRRNANTKATITSLGVPSVHPQMIVRVEGVGETFSGAYRVLKATHNLTTSGYDMSIELLRASSSGNPRSPDVTAAGRTNNAQGEADAPGGTVKPVQGGK